jgi:flagellar hook assembly protein FlgD
MYALSDNYPNPFNSITNIEYELKTGSHVDVSVYNILGQRINTLVDRTESAGQHSTIWNGTNFEGDPVPTGIYFYRIEAGTFTETKKMLLLK